MKSLEIVNEMLNYPFEERILTELATNETIIREEELETIKQDLEVLEILRKGMSSTKYKVFQSNDMDFIKCTRIAMREIKEDEFDREEFNKVKQWFEENENV